MGAPPTSAEMAHSATLQARIGTLDAQAPNEITTPAPPPPYQASSADSSSPHPEEQKQPHLPPRQPARSNSYDRERQLNQIKSQRPHIQQPQNYRQPQPQYQAQHMGSREAIEPPLSGGRRWDSSHDDGEYTNGGFGPNVVFVTEEHNGKKEREDALCGFCAGCAGACACCYCVVM